MSEKAELPDGDILLRLIKQSLKTEGAVELKGEYNGLPLFVVVAVGASAGLLERYARNGTLCLTPNED